MIRFISSKEIWTNDDLIAYFGIDLSEYGILSESSISTTEPKTNEIFFISENPIEWRELAKRFVFENPNMVTNFNKIASGIIAKNVAFKTNFIMEVLEKNESYLKFTNKNIKPKIKQIKEIQNNTNEQPQNNNAQTTSDELDKLNKAIES